MDAKQEAQFRALHMVVAAMIAVMPNRDEFHAVVRHLSQNFLDGMEGSGMPSHAKNSWTDEIESLLLSPEA
jgi:hypothetical protein